MPSRYEHLSHDELVRLLDARDRRDATRFGLVWEANEIERDQAVNGDFVALDLDPALSTPAPDGGWQNLIIEGDNFDALRHLRMTHAGQVKCIYIDPPYNTGNRDFVYNDRFVDANDSWRHSTWCEFIYQRLMLAKDLLRQDGVIFVSIDDNEVFTLGMLMQKVFGPDSFVANCVWQKRYSRENRGSIGDAHEYILVFARNPSAFQQTCGRIPMSPDQSKIFKNPNKDPNGPWATVSLNAQGHRPNQMYAITAPNGKVHYPPEGRCWSMIEPQFKKLLEANKIYWGKDGNGVPRIIRYLSEVDGLVPWTWWPHEEVGHTDEARKEIREWLDTQTAFQTPKPLRLLDRILRIATGPDDLVLDFFAGSGTTAHAVMKLNAEDGGRRRFILVSNSEATAAEPEKNLCRDVCARRVRRAIEGYKDHAPLPGDFAYLRCRRISPGRLLEIEHEQVWSALQLIHGEALRPWSASPLQCSRTADAVLLYLPRFHRSILPVLRRELADGTAAVLYSWQPELLRQHLRADHVQYEAIPESLARRFGMKV